MARYLFVFNIACLSPDYLNFLEKMENFSKLMKTGKKALLEPVFPGLTIPCQASLATGVYPDRHGMIANGLFDRDRLEVSFWDQYRSLLLAEPFWEKMKAARPEFKTAVLFWQNTLYGKADIIITPRPMHTEQGLIQWCYSRPVGLYEELSKEIGPFDLMDYWGPMASGKASIWINKAAMEVLKKHKPNLMMIYLPHLDYSCQKYGPKDSKVMEDLMVIDDLIGNFMNELEDLGIKRDSMVAVLSEYSLAQVSKAVCPNLLLRRAGFLKVRSIEGREYLDIEMSRAFAMVDHQIAHIYVKKEYENNVLNLLKQTDGIDFVLDRQQQQNFQVNHLRSGELLAVADPDKWFAYYWWDDPEKAPDFAHTVDIHRKPGYDPLELFLDSEKMQIPVDPLLVNGSHGRPANGQENMAVFMLSGENIENIRILPRLPMVEVASILEEACRN